MDRTATRDPGGVDHDVESPVRGHHLRHGRGHHRRVGHVGDAQLPRRSGVTGVLIGQIDTDDGRTLRIQTVGTRGADPRCRPGHQGTLPVESSHCSP